ncbi:MAG: antigen [Methanolobus sp. T82-4]|nr:MAG: antigen [Methanolobus sp. T82-4]
MAVPNILSAGSMDGDKIVNDQGEDLGDVKDIMIDLESGSIAYVVLSFGGFLGLGDKLFGVPVEALRKKPEEHEFVLDVDKQKLENAPGFDKDNWPGTHGDHQEYMRTIYSHYGYEQRTARGTQIIGEEREEVRPREEAKQTREQAPEAVAAAPVGAKAAAAGEEIRTGETQSREIYQILKNEHDKVLGLFDEAINTGSRDTFMQIKAELDPHMNGEEEVLYPVLKKEGRTHDISMEGYEEHHVAKMLLSELDNMNEKDEMWIPKLKVLKENVKHHVEEEEKEMFPASKNVLSDQRAEEIGQKYLDFKDRYSSAHGKNM